MRATTAEGYVVVLADTGLEHLVKPISVGCILEVVLAILTHLVATRDRSVGVGASCTKILAILVGVHHVIYIARNLVNTEVTRVVYLQRLVFLTILGSDDNDTIGSTRTVDGTRRSILQNLDGLDIIWREVTDSGTHWHTVDDIERSRATEGADTTDTYARVGTWLTVGCNLHTCHLTFKHGRDVGVRYLLHLLSVHDRNGTGKVGLLLRTITYYNHLVEQVIICRKLDGFQDGASAYSDFTLLEAQVAYDKSCVCLDADLEVTVQIGNCAGLGILCLDCCTDHRFTLIIYNLTLYCNHLILCYSSHRCHWGSKRSTTNSSQA